MKSTWKLGIAAVAALAAVAVLGAGLALAQGGTPWQGMGGMMGSYGRSAGTPAWGGMMGRGGMMAQGTGDEDDWETMQAMRAWMGAPGGMHNLVANSLAEALGLTPDELQAALAGGQTLAQVAEAQGVTPAELADHLEAAMESALKAAVEAGTLTQAQADAMLAQMSGRYAWMIEHMSSDAFGPGSNHPCHNSNRPQTGG